MSRGPTDPDFFSSARSFPTSVGSAVAVDGVRGYYIDFRFKAEEPRWPPAWLAPRDEQLHVATAQWALGALDRFLTGEGEEWLKAAVEAGNYLLQEQEQTGSRAGAWLHGTSLRATYLLPAPWTSGMAQGECASVLVRLHQETGENRYAEAAIQGLQPMRRLSTTGGVRAILDRGPFFEEYPTVPPSFVLNGGIFALWGLHDVAMALDDEDAKEDWEAGVDTLARNIHRWDTGYWSLYDLFPHPIPNVASSAYHALHTAQLRALNLIAPRPEFELAIGRFESYMDSRLNPLRAFVEKASFRALVPRSRRLAHSLPWSEAQRQRVRPKSVASPLVLCYHAVSDAWPSSLSVSPAQLRAQLQYLLRRGYRGVTFSQVVAGDLPRKSVAVTFDDGYRSVLENAFPVLTELGMPGTVFVPTGFVGSGKPMEWPGIDQWARGPHAEELCPMSWDELRTVRDAGWEVASHTVTHRRLPELDDEQLTHELTASKADCARELGLSNVTLAYPYGAHDDRVREAASRAGYVAAAAVRPGPAKPLQWPRIGIYPADRPWRFGVKASRAVRRLRSSHFGMLLEKRRHPKDRLS